MENDDIFEHRSYLTKRIFEKPCTCNYSGSELFLFVLNSLRFTDEIVGIANSGLEKDKLLLEYFGTTGKELYEIIDLILGS